jgi:hypothetical protein
VLDGILRDLRVDQTVSSGPTAKIRALTFFFGSRLGPPQQPHPLDVCRTEHEDQAHVR